MPDSGLQNFCGDYLQIVGAPTRTPDGISVQLESHQGDKNFLATCKNAADKTVFSTRRILLWHGVVAEVDPTSVVVGRTRLTARAILKCITPDGVEMLDHLHDGMWVVRPSHFNGAEPIDKDRAVLALRCGHLQADDQQTDALEAMSADGACRMNVTPGRLRYYGGDKTSSYWHEVAARLQAPTDNAGKFSEPEWFEERGPVDPGEMAALRVNTLLSGIHSYCVSITTTAGSQNYVVSSPSKPFYLVTQNAMEHPVRPGSLGIKLYDRRPRQLVIPSSSVERATPLLTHSYEAANAFLERLTHFAWGRRQDRPAALVINHDGIEEVMHASPGDQLPLVCTGSDTTAEERCRLEVHQMSTPLLLPTPDVVTDSQETPSVRLLRRAHQLSVDGRGVLASPTLPPHGALNALAAEYVTGHGSPVVETLLFRDPSLSHGSYFSQNDHSLLRELLIRGMSVYWANADISHRENGSWKKGTLLELVELRKRRKKDEESSCFMFVPPEMKEAFLNGVHVAWYGTARVLEKPYIRFMEEVVRGISDLRTFKNIDASDSLPMQSDRPPARHLIMHSGGGPDLSTMGTANQLARQYGFISAGHPLGVKVEPMGSNLDCLFPFRNTARDTRQGNMARAADIVIAVEGGGGTREERGIALTDLAIAVDSPFPLILVGVGYYLNEYLQYLKEVMEGNLDDHVLDCVSLADLSQAQQVGVIIRSYVQNQHTLQGLLPSKLPAPLQEQVDAFVGANGLGSPGMSLVELRDEAKRRFAAKIVERKRDWLKEPE